MLKIYHLLHTSIETFSVVFSSCRWIKWLYFSATYRPKQLSFQRPVTYLFCSPDKEKLALPLKVKTELLPLLCNYAGMKLIHAVSHVPLTFGVFLSSQQKVPGKIWHLPTVFQRVAVILPSHTKSERATFARVVSTERSHPPTQEGVGACKWTTWGSGAFCLKDCCLIHLRHAQCTALRGNRQEPPLCTPKDITYYEDSFWEGICDMKPVITK